MPYLNLIRYKNLLFLALTLWCMQRCVVEPILALYGFDFASQPLGAWQFALLVLSSLCIAGAGYAINDYFDVKIDTINRPLTRIVGVSIDRSKAMLTHQILTAVGIVAGIALSISVRSTLLGIIFIFIPGLLWFYSATYKRQFLIGNVIVALNAALGVFIVAIANVAALRHMYPEQLLMQTPIVPMIYAWMGGFALFAFLLTLVREIVKDMEDETGDREMECHTLPITIGTTKTKIVVISLIILSAALLAWLILRHASNSLTWRYAAFGVFLPLFVLCLLVGTARKISDYHNAQQLARYIMLIGTLYSVVFYYKLAQTAGISFFGLLAK